MQRSRAASHDSARIAPGAARPLTMLGGRGLHHHHSRPAAVDRGRAGRSSICRPRRFCQCGYWHYFFLEPSGKPVGPNSHTRRTASFHPLSGTRPLQGADGTHQSCFSPTARCIGSIAPLQPACTALHVGILRLLCPPRSSHVDRTAPCTGSGHLLHHFSPSAERHHHSALRPARVAAGLSPLGGTGTRCNSPF
jgi:hypothetical protein